jgi:hypothetical protein
MFWSSRSAAAATAAEEEDPRQNEALPETDAVADPTPPDEDAPEAQQPSQAELVAQGMSELDQLDRDWRTGLSRQLDYLRAPPSNDATEDASEETATEEAEEEVPTLPAVVEATTEKEEAPQSVQEEDAPDSPPPAVDTSASSDSSDSHSSDSPQDNDDNRDVVLRKKTKSATRPSPTSWMERKLLGGGTLSHTQALECTVSTLRAQLERMEEERDSLLQLVDRLEDKVEVQRAKTEVLEHFFRQVNQSGRGGEDTSYSSSSVSEMPSVQSLEFGNNTSSSSSSPDAEGGGFEFRRSADHQSTSSSLDYYDEDEEEAWDLEGAPPKLSGTFGTTGAKMRSAKSRAARKTARRLAKVVCV